MSRGCIHPPSVSNIQILRNPSNVGATQNFKALLDKATTPYFMWLGAHDMLTGGYTESLVALLEDNPQMVMAYGNSIHVGPDDKRLYTYNYFFNDMLSSPNSWVRTLGLVRYLTDCSLLHGVFRTDVLRNAWHDYGGQIYLGADHVLLGHAACYGSFVYCPVAQLLRRDPHVNDRAEIQLTRMSALPSTREQLGYKTMQKKQFAIATRISKSTGCNGVAYRLKIRYFLVKRFGVFGGQWASRLFDRLLLRL
jgi:hypothetical protein